MKKHLVGFLCLMGLCGALRAQDIKFTIDAGLLENTTGTANVPVGGLLQLIASPSGTFSAPTSTSYVSGDNVLFASFAMNYGSGTAGETFNGFTGFPLSTANYTLVAGEAVLLRFYPSLTYSSSTNYFTSAPTLATTYGQVRSSTVEFGPAGGDATETPWVLPAAGDTGVDLDYITMNDPNGGTYANASAFATNIVLVGVPEPSIYAMFIGGFLGILGLHAWGRRKGLGAAA